ncbi:hypothetical protein FKM82_000206 [Ascaphus truei]
MIKTIQRPSGGQTPLTWRFTGTTPGQDGHPHPPKKPRLTSLLLSCPPMDSCPPTRTPRMDQAPLQHRSRSRPPQQDSRLQPDFAPPLIHPPQPVTAAPRDSNSVSAPGR